MDKIVTLQLELNSRLKQLHTDIQNLLNNEYQSSGKIFKFNLTYNSVFSVFDVSLLLEGNSENNKVYTGNGYNLLYSTSFSSIDNLIQLLDSY